MEKYMFNIWNNDRTVRKLFISSPLIEAIIEKAASYGIIGSKLVLENNGSDICGNDVLEYIIKNNPQSVFLLLNENDQWISAETTPNLENEKPSKPVLSIINEAGSEVPLFIEDIDEEFEVTYTDDTLSMSSTALSSSSSTNSECRKLFTNFQIPWNKMPHDVNEMLKNKTKLGKRLNIMANIIVDELRASSFYIPMGVFRNVAQKAAEMYPDSIIEKDNEGKYITTEPLALIQKMRNRNNTLNREPNTRSNSFSIHIKNRKKTNVLKSTCTNWQPSENDENTNSASTIQYKKQVLQDLHRKGTVTSKERQKIKNFMRDCFNTQRLFLNNTEEIPAIAEVLREWPYLFDATILIEHFNQLMNIDLDIFRSNFDAGLNKIVNFLQNCSYFRAEKIEFTAIDVIKYLSRYFKEDINYLLKEFAFGTTLDEVTGEIPTNTPWAAIIKSVDPKADAVLLYIFIEKTEVIHQQSGNIITILQYIVSLYYVLNIMYPKEISQTMEFLVRFYLKHYSEAVRGAKKTSSNISKINTLISKLNS